MTIKQFSRVNNCCRYEFFFFHGNENYLKNIKLVMRNNETRALTQKVEKYNISTGEHFLLVYKEAKDYIFIITCYINIIV